MCQHKVTYDSARNSGYNIIRNQTILIWVDICVQVLQRKEKAMITIITNIYLEFMLLPVYNNSCDLLVHENENGDQQSRDGSRKVHPPGVFSKWRHKPTAVRTCWLEEERKQSIWIHTTLWKINRGDTLLVFESQHKKWKEFYG